MEVKLYGDREDFILMMKYYKETLYVRVFTYLEVQTKKDNLKMMSGLLNLIIKNANRF